MAINIYSGVMGSGKSYEVMVSVVIPAIRTGRRVVTNIEGISEEKIYAYLERLGAEHSDFGSVVHISDARIEEPGFFPTEAAPDAVVQGGDLVVIDEAWRFWAAGNKLSPEHMEFFRMHRHWVHPDTKVTCDLALVFQSVTDISRSLRAVVEIHFSMRKLKSLGLARSYSVTWYEGGKQTRQALSGQNVRRYNKAIFPLYQSYSGGSGSELMVDKRQKILSVKKVAFFAILLLLLTGFGLWSGWGFFHSDFSSDKPQPESDSTVSLASTPVVAAQGVSRASGSADTPLGVVTVRGVRRVVSVRDGRVKFEDYEGCSGRGLSLECR